MWLLPALFLLLVLTGCDQTGSSMRGRTVAGQTPAPAKPQIKVDAVRLHTDDGLTLRGKIFGDGDTGVVLAHMFPADQGSWTDFAKELARSGEYTVLTFNFRGYGLSDGVKDIAHIDRDMLAAVRYLSEGSEKVFVIGASMGGTAALRIASEHEVAGVATLSSPTHFRGLSAGEGLGQIEGAKLFIAAGRDGGAPEAARGFYDRVREPRELEIVQGDAHGTDMLAQPNNTVRDILKNWLAKTE